MNALRTTLPRLAGSTPSARAFSTTAPRSLAKMTVVGRLADTPELQATSTGRDIIRYAVGVNTGPRDENGNRQTSWFRLASFAEGGQRDFLLSLPKGSLMYVEADAKMDSFQTAEGQSRSALNLLTRNFEVLSRPRTNAQEGTTGVESSTNAAQEPLSGIGHS